MSSDNKLDKAGLSYFWNKAMTYIQNNTENIRRLSEKIGNAPLPTVATTIAGATEELRAIVGTGASIGYSTMTQAINAIKDKLLSYTSTEINVSDGVTETKFTATRYGKIVHLDFGFDLTDELPSQSTIFSGLAETYLPSYTVYGLVIRSGVSASSRIELKPTGEIVTYINFPAGTGYRGSLTYILD